VRCGVAHDVPLHRLDLSASPGWFSDVADPERGTKRYNLAQRQLPNWPAARRDALDAYHGYSERFRPALAELGTGNVYAQPLAVSNVNASNCPSPTPCDLIFVATEEDMLYAFVAGASSSSPVWSVNLAQIPNSQGTPVDCRNWPESCQQNNSPIYPYLGITGTPVVDPNAGILYVVTWVQLAVNPYNVQYYLHAINITNGQEKTGSPVQVAASLSAGLATTPAACTTGSGPGPLTFNPRHHLQRTGLLLLSLSNGTPVIYIGFNPIRGELQNGWILGYSYNTGTGFSTTPVAAISTTPYGTGGGVWGAGTGLASDGSYIFQQRPANYSWPSGEFSNTDSIQGQAVHGNQERSGRVWALPVRRLSFAVGE
jgi:hypothetical protein